MVKCNICQNNCNTIIFPYGSAQVSSFALFATSGAPGPGRGSVAHRLLEAGSADSVLAELTVKLQPLQEKKVFQSHFSLGL